FDPLVRWLEKRGLSRMVSFLLVFAVVVIFLVLLIMNVVPQLVQQAIQLTQSLPGYAEEANNWLVELGKQEEFKNFNIEKQLESIDLTLNNIIHWVISSVTTSLSYIFSALTKFFVLLFTVPFILIFMFKDGHRFMNSLDVFFPHNLRSELRATVKD